MLLFFVVCGIRSLKILLFPMAAVYIIPYIWNRLMGKPLLALLVIGASGFFHMNDSLFCLIQLILMQKKAHNSRASAATAPWANITPGDILESRITGG